MPDAKIVYRMDNGTYYTCPIPKWWERHHHEEAMSGVADAMTQGVFACVECEECGFVSVNPAHVVAVEFVGGWKVPRDA